jgi:hypothetical protein
VVTRTLDGRRVVLVAGDERWRPAVLDGLRARGADVVVIGEAEGLLAGDARVLDPARTPADIRARLAEVGPADAVIIHPPPKRTVPLKLVGGVVPRRLQLEAARALEDDALWAESLELGLAVPWRWMIAALAHVERRPRGRVVVLVPGTIRPDWAPPDEAACREALACFVRVHALNSQAGTHTLNAVQLVPAADPEELAGTCATLCATDGVGVHGQILTVRGTMTT